MENQMENNNFMQYVNDLGRLAIQAEEQIQELQGQQLEQAISDDELNQILESEENQEEALRIRRQYLRQIIVFIKKVSKKSFIFSCEALKFQPAIGIQAIVKYMPRLLKHIFKKELIINPLNLQALESLKAVSKISQTFSVTFKSILTCRWNIIISSVICVGEIGFQIYRWMTDQINSKIFFLRFSRIVGEAIVGYGLAAGGAALGATIGSTIFPGVGTVIGGILGALICGVLSYFGCKFVEKKIGLDAYEEDLFSKWEEKKKETFYEKQLEVLKLTKNSSQEEVIRKKKMLLIAYHPDKCQNSDKEINRIEFIKVGIAFESIKEYRKIRNNWQE